MKILHVLDHSIPLHSGYTFRTRSILNQQHTLGWETWHVTSPKQGECGSPVEDVDGLRFYRTPVPRGLSSKLPVLNQLGLIRPMTDRILEVIEEHKPDIIHAHSPALNGLAALKAGRKSGFTSGVRNTSVLGRCSGGSWHVQRRRSAIPPNTKNGNSRCQTC